MILRIEKHEKRKGHWCGLYQCLCGKEHIARNSHVENGQIKSCGCGINSKSRTHGKSGTPTYKTWEGIKRRCGNSNDSSFRKYGAIGVYICERWKSSFQNFLEDMGEKPEGMTIDRIDNKKGYEPGNCRWATWEDQQNNRSNNRKFEMDGKIQTVDRWARELEVDRDAIWRQIKKGKTIKDAIEYAKNRKLKNVILRNV